MFLQKKTVTTFRAEITPQPLQHGNSWHGCTFTALACKQAWSESHLLSRQRVTCPLACLTVSPLVSMLSPVGYYEAERGLRSKLQGVPLYLTSFYKTSDILMILISFDLLEFLVTTWPLKLIWIFDGT